jgi:hypothetical protein
VVYRLDLEPQLGGHRGNVAGELDLVVYHNWIKATVASQRGTLGVAYHHDFVDFILHKVNLTQHRPTPTNTRFCYPV